MMQSVLNNSKLFVEKNNVYKQVLGEILEYGHLVGWLPDDYTISHAHEIVHDTHVYSGPGWYQLTGTKFAYIDADSDEYTFCVVE